MQITAYKNASLAEMAKTLEWGAQQQIDAENELMKRWAAKCGDEYVDYQAYGTTTDERVDMAVEDLGELNG